ncbi:DUF1613-domain-containing protein [Thelephora ganbajun]|uniref:DUF1613-domain-containing protein n=1 Tax=Thelephora ganbajun TaxID=370292 RepID=A0ACB6ZLN0_THEGA|nr:DUF1613-domain-containing protein [Thelephora ganbajun]
MTSPQQRFVFSPTPCDQRSPGLQDARGDTVWTPLISCPAQFPVELFADAGQQLVDHPEYNSTLILRSETLTELLPESGELPQAIPRLRGTFVLKSTLRKLLPRRPGRDGSVDQHCTMYAIEGHHGASILILTPLPDQAGSLPYYHPQVFHIAFRYLPSPASDPHDGVNAAPSARLQVEVVAFPNVPLDPNSRVYRTCLALLETLHRYGWGAMTSYKKRVNHDRIIPREEYQDLYLLMRERHKHHVDSWQESTDPLKHVFEDIGIATFLILLWKKMFNVDRTGAPIGTNDPRTRDGVRNSYNARDEDGSPPWFSWPGPPGGFIDLGCGNGLLVHILLSEGYQGFGVDVRARTSWSHYPLSTQRHLHVKALDPTLSLTGADPGTIVSDLTIAETPPSIEPDTDPSGSLQCSQKEKDDQAPSPLQIPRGVFVIGNHADELTPYVPILSIMYGASGYLNIPCCPWDLDQKFSRANSEQYPLPGCDIDDNDGPGEVSAGTRVGDTMAGDDRWIESLNLGGDGKFTSSYSVYRIWLARLTSWCGWETETEVLRIPSTRNWALVGRKRRRREEVSRQRVEEILTKVREREVFAVRRPEGRQGDH